jgi:hypothetical protein
VPIFDFSGVDVFALVDADTDEAHAFTTYLNYWECLAAGVRATYGSYPYAALLEELQARRSFRGLSGRGRPNAPDKVRALLLNAWVSELRA